MKFDFENLEPVDVSTSTLLPIGNHVVTIDTVEGSETRNGYPQIELNMSNPNGSRKDWLVYNSEFGARKVVTLFNAAGVPLPTADDQDDDGKLSDACIARLKGKTVGIVVREEEYKGEKNPRVKGYVDPAQIDADAPADTAGLPDPGASSTRHSDDDIPF